MTISSIKKADGDHDEICVEELDDQGNSKDTEETYPRALLGFE
jgi:hypothetical protein